MEERFETFTVLITRISRSIKRIKADEMADFELKGPHVSCLYYLFGGRDVTGRIAKITMTQNGETCTMENAEGKTHFLFCTELSPQLGDYDFDRSTLRFYDKDGNDITAEYNLSGGGIG